MNVDGYRLEKGDLFFGEKGGRWPYFKSDVFDKRNKKIGTVELLSHPHSSKGGIAFSVRFTKKSDD